MNDSWKVNDTSDELHVTFMFHCAFVRTEGARRTDVILAPGFTPTGAQTAAEHGNGHGDGMTDDHDAGEPGSPAHAHPMQHIASLRVPAACVLEAQHPADETQETATLDPVAGTTTVNEDKIWRLEGFDVSIQPDPLNARGAAAAPANFKGSASDGDTTYTLANISKLSGKKIDSRFTEDRVPDLLHPGARVRVWGGTFTCGVPGGLLKDRTWDLGLANPVGLSDRVDYKRTIPGGVVSIVFKPFDGGEAKTVKLQPQNGVIRLHITNDPFAEDTPHGSREKSPCETLPHFGSYAVLLEPAGTVATLSAPPIANAGDPALLTISEGNTFCCPCSDGAP